MKTIEELKVKIFADGADKAGMLEMYAKPYIKGMTTNPTLMRKAGIADYRAFARDILAAIPDRPISFEVFSDEFRRNGACRRMDIAGWGPTSTSRYRSPIRVASLIWADSHAGKAQDPCERYGHDDARPGAGDDGSSGGGRPELRFRIRRANRRYRARPGADNVRRRQRHSNQNRPRS